MVFVRDLRARRDERGAIAVLVAVFSVVTFLIGALVVNLGQARDVRRQSQNAADAAALAGATAMYDSSGTVQLAAGTAAVKSYASKNFGITDAQWASCVDPNPLPASSGTPCISYDSATAPTTVRVRVPDAKVSTPFAGIIGVYSVNVASVAEAQAKPGGRAQCGLCVIGTGVHDIQNGNITINGASAYFNGSVDAQNNGSITVTGTGSTISVQGTTSPKGTFSPAPKTGQPQIQDPLAFLTLPPAGTSGLSNKAGSACTGGPGIYYNTFQFTSCTLSPGLYVLAGTQTEHESGNTNVVAPGVTFYFTCANSKLTAIRACNYNGGLGETGAAFLFTGNASLRVSAPTSGANQGLAIVSDRNNTATFGFRGNGTDPSSGTIYAASGTFDYRGNGSGPALDSLTVVKDLTFSGNNASFSSQYSQDKNFKLPPGIANLSK